MITKDLLKNWGACREGCEWFLHNFPNGGDFPEIMEKLESDNHGDWAEWLFERCRESNLYPEITLGGFKNSGDRNSGDRNSGHWNSGDMNSGDMNSGRRNSGSWNSGHWNSGFFNTMTPDRILVFNQWCDHETWAHAYKPDFLYFSLTYWVPEDQMSDEAKIADPDFYVHGGQLQTMGYKEAFQRAWDEANLEDRIKVKDLPNFDAGIFYEISGIDLRPE